MWLSGRTSSIRSVGGLTWAGLGMVCSLFLCWRGAGQARRLTRPRPLARVSQIEFSCLLACLPPPPHLPLSGRAREDEGRGCLVRARSRRLVGSRGGFRGPEPIEQVRSAHRSSAARSSSKPEPPLAAIGQHSDDGKSGQPLLDRRLMDNYPQTCLVKISAISASCGPNPASTGLGADCMTHIDGCAPVKYPRTRPRLSAPATLWPHGAWPR